MWRSSPHHCLNLGLNRLVVIEQVAAAMRETVRFLARLGHLSLNHAESAADLAALGNRQRLLLAAGLHSSKGASNDRANRAV